MTKKQSKNLTDYIMPLNMNGMHGRMLYIPPPKNKKREMLLVYGHHASIERMFGVAEDLNQYGGITLPDLPGFDDMDSFYSIGEKPTLDNMADYLASFIKLRFRGKKITILAMSFGFIIVTHMLQKHPELVKKVDLLISIVGFTHREDLKFKKSLYRTLRLAASVFSNRFPAWVAKTFILRGPIIRATYLKVADKHSKLKDADQQERDRRIDFEIKLWKINDFRTYSETTLSMLNLDLCHKKIKLPIHNISVAQDRYLNQKNVEKHMREIFSDYDNSKSKMKAHAPTVIADVKASAPLIPDQIRKLLSKKPR